MNDFAAIYGTKIVHTRQIVAGGFAKSRIPVKSLHSRPEMKSPKMVNTQQAAVCRYRRRLYMEIRRISCTAEVSMATT